MVMDEIKPIETRYLGYRFRSRLEARWAVFFKSLGIEFEYEKEGFELGKWGRYLPDFFLPLQNVWVEIKPKNQIEFDNEGYVRDMLKAAAFVSKPGSGTLHRSLVLCYGNPWPGEYELAAALDGMPIGPGNISGVWALDRKDSRSLWISGDGGAFQLNRSEKEHDKWPMTDSEELRRAYEQARSARFEHGESPSV